MNGSTIHVGALSMDEKLQRMGCNRYEEVHHRLITYLHRKEFWYLHVPVFSRCQNLLRYVAVGTYPHLSWYYLVASDICFSLGLGAGFLFTRPAPVPIVLATPLAPSLCFCCCSSFGDSPCSIRSWDESLLPDCAFMTFAGCIQCFHQSGRTRSRVGLSTVRSYRKVRLDRTTNRQSWTGLAWSGLVHSY
jgi:hypothetical protein